MNANDDNVLMRYLPWAAGAFLVVVFCRLGLWQLDRAQQKIDLHNAFQNPAGHIAIPDDRLPNQYEQLFAYGRYMTHRQVLIENAVVDSKLGYWVITPFVFGSNDAPLLINRGWVEKSQDGSLPDLTLPQERITVRGKSGALPKVGIRPGEAFENVGDWPRLAVWPTVDEIATQLERPVQEFVLLLDPAEPHGFKRDWVPKVSGPSTHYGYAFQWFAMAAAVLVLLFWFARRARAKATDND